MGSIGAMVAGSSDRYRQPGSTTGKLVPEGVEGRVPYKGNLSPFIYQLVGRLAGGHGILRHTEHRRVADADPVSFS